MYILKQNKNIRYKATSLKVKDVSTIKNFKGLLTEKSKY